jgi:predicted DNA-binding protein (UPF0278 family)
MDYKDYLNEVFSIDDKYYVAYTIFSIPSYVAVSIESFDEAMKLINNATSMQVQFTQEPKPFTYKEMMNFLDKLANNEVKNKMQYNFLYGKGVDPKRINTI